MIKWLLVFLLWCGVAEAGLDLDGADDFVSVGAQAELNVQNYTVACWYKSSGITGSTEAETVFENSGTGGFALNVHQNNIGTRDNNDVACWVNDGSWKSTSTSSDTLTTNVWSHIACTLGSGTIRLYVNGAEINSTGSIGTVAYTSTAVYIGKDAGGADTYSFGQVNECAMWDVALTATEMSQLYNSKMKRLPLNIDPTNLIGYWPLDDEEDGSSGDGDAFADMSTNRNNGTGDDGANNTGLTAKAEEVLSYPDDD